MKTIDTPNAVGTILCHDLTRIVKGKVKETAFRKGHVIQPADIDPLLSMGKTRLYVWDPGPGMVHENEAVETLASHCHLAGQFNLTQAKEGRIDVYSRKSGLYLVNVSLLEKLNVIEEIVVAVRLGGVDVKKGDLLAGIKIIPLAIHQSKLEKIKEIQSDVPLMTVKPFKKLKAAIIATGSEIYNGRIRDTFTPTVEEKIARYGIKTVSKVVCDDSAEDIKNQILASREAGAELILCTGGMSVDPDDLTPGAIRETGAEVVTYGTPVLPGAMLMVAYLGDVPVLGLPGCVMHDTKTVFDVIMPRVAAGVRLSRDEISRMGHGGLCLSCRTCVFPNCGFGRAQNGLPPM
ncbi:MAG: molybdopterin-binding protein [Deltaproteobacteria bacterium]|jgi:molybdenum cofactor synthesis domain-containing protein|nr:molybdopterin-binding protein [Deltaproteobacteria bacterium]